LKGGWYERPEMLTRREMLFALLLAGVILPAGGAWAKDGGSDNSGSGSDNSGSGSDNSGSGNDETEEGGSGNSGSGSGHSGKYLDQYGAREAVRSGNAMPLEDALKKLRARHPGKVIAVSMGVAESRLCYWFKVKSGDGNVRKVVMDAKTGAIRGLFGFGGS
jgi:Peptidase propeptide and YPEB domain